MSSQYPDAPKAQPVDNPNWSKLNLQTRNLWEESIEHKYLIKMIKDYDTQVDHTTPATIGWCYGRSWATMRRRYVGSENQKSNLRFPKQVSLPQRLLSVIPPTT